MTEPIITRDLPGQTVGEADSVNRVLHTGPVISWRGIFAGAFVGALAYLGLTALGTAFSGIGIEQAVEAGEGGTALTIGAGMWLIVTAIASLFVGGFVAARASGIIPTRIGGIEGLVVASLFFLLLFAGIWTGMGALGSGIAGGVRTVGGGVAILAQNPQVQSVVERSMGDLNLKSEPTQVVQGVAVRLLRGDDEAATAYLANQAGISTQQANQHIQQVKTQVLATANDVGQAVGRATQIIGWVLFGIILFGSAAALFGGAIGARRNIRRPLSERDQQMALEAQSEWYGRTPATPLVITGEPSPILPSAR